VDDPRSVFGQAVRRFRLRLTISQEELAARAGLDRSYIGQVERGETNISLLNIVRIAQALGVGADKLVRNLRLSAFNPERER
jgi:transcriptional regulator with XRE-family HTH domain